MSFKQKLRDRQVASLVNADYACPSLVRFLGSVAIDAVMIDCEQGTASFSEVEQITCAARLSGIASIVRIPSPEPWTIERYMLRDIDGVVVPRLQSAQQVEQAVRDIRYCAPRNFDDKVVIVQVEAVSAIAELDGFLSVPEVDCFFIGPVDLAKSMGFAGEYSHPAVLAAIDEVIRRALDHNRCVGMLVKERDLAAWLSKGVTMLYTHVNDFISLGAREWRQVAGLTRA